MSAGLDGATSISWKRWSAKLLVPFLVALLAWSYSIIYGKDDNRNSPLTERLSVNTSRAEITLRQASQILARALEIASTPVDESLLTRALLEFQNPELSIFAGPGHGVKLRNPNPGSTIEAFPRGRIPKADGRSGYDEWTRVKALRYAAERIDTAAWTQTSTQTKHTAIDQMEMVQAALLLATAGAVDYQNPMPPASTRNSYMEAVKNMIANAETLAIDLIRRYNKTQWKPYDAHSLAPAFAIYAVPSQDDHYLDLAQNVVTACSCRSLPHPANLTLVARSNAHHLDSVTRVLITHERWMHSSIDGHRRQENTMRTEMLRMCAQSMVQACFDDLSNTPQDRGIPLMEDTSRALVASSIYRLAVFMPDWTSEWISQADDMYYTIAAASTVEFLSGEQRLAYEHGRESEILSTILLMWSARRDCVGFGICDAL